VERFDLVVVGAGPGGSAATSVALAAGLRVAQLDRARFPRVKPCAGGLTPKAVRALLVALQPSLRGAFREFEFNAWRGARTVYSFRETLIAMVSRPELDNRLVCGNRAHPGLTFLEGEPVRALERDRGAFVVRTARRALRAPQLVGADGANGIVNRVFRAAEPRARALAVEVVLRCADLACAPPPRPCFDFGAVPRGYGWVFPKEGEVSAGLYTLSRGLEDVRGRLAAYLAAKGLRLARGDALESFEAHTIPLGGRLSDPGMPLYLVGDAAGLADALTGEGIYHALESGRIAGELAARVHAGTDSPSSYLRLLERPVLRDARWTLRLARPFYRRPDLALALLRRTLWRPLVHGTGTGATFSASVLGAAGLWEESLRTRSAGRTVGE
jgi:geranylgeranyl reductase family protein